jgi:putative glutamine amidotransferase
MLRPLIGITAYTRGWVEKGWDYDVSYASNATAVEAAGGLPVLIPAKVSLDTLRGIYERLDGVLLPGGGDVAPELYRADRHTTTGNIDNDRDRTEIALTRWAMEDDVPTFGICRGIQVMNVALGGTLKQDIPSMVQTDLMHDIPDGEPRSRILHTVTFQPKSRLADIVGENTVDVNSLHHQSIEEPASSAVVTAYAPDGVPEALEVPDRQFIMAVQWHPEDLIDDTRMLNIFKAFVEAARQRMARRMMANGA